MYTIINKLVSLRSSVVSLEYKSSNQCGAIDDLHLFLKQSNHFIKQAHTYLTAEFVQSPLLF